RSPYTPLFRPRAVRLGLVVLATARDLRRAVGVVATAVVRMVAVALPATGAVLVGDRVPPFGRVLDAQALVVPAERELLHLVGRVEHAQLGRGLRDRGADRRALLLRHPFGALEHRDDLGERHALRYGAGLADTNVLDRPVEPDRRLARGTRRTGARHARRGGEQHRGGQAGREGAGDERAEQPGSSATCGHETVGAGHGVAEGTQEPRAGRRLVAHTSPSGRRASCWCAVGPFRILLQDYHVQVNSNGVIFSGPVNPPSRRTGARQTMTRHRRPG